MSDKKSRSIFDLFFPFKGDPMKIHQGKHRKVAIFPDWAKFPIIDGHFICHDEDGHVVAICKEDMKKILEELA